MITSPIEMLELPNLDHMTTSTMQFESNDKNFVCDIMDINYDFISFISKYRYLEKAWDSHFC